MRKFFHIFLLFLLLLPSCKQSGAFSERQAEESTMRLIEALQSRDMNRVWDVVKESQGAIFYVFDNNQLIFWSDNALASREVPSRDYSRKWYDYHFDNADARIMWTRYGSLEVMTVLPIEWDIHSAEVLEQSFSYLPLQQQGAQPWLQAARVRVRAYYILLVAIGAVLLLLVIGTLWRNRGFGNIKLANKIQVLLTLLLVLSFSYVIFSVVRFERIRYKEKQAQRLQEKCEYVRSALQNLYYWDFFLSEDNTAG